MQNKSRNKLLKSIIFSVVAAVIVAALVLVIFLRAPEPQSDPHIDEENNTVSQPVVEDDHDEQEEIKEPETINKVEMLPEMAELYAENPDIIGWVKIEGTNVDYPVMYTPDDEEKYLYRGFDGKYNAEGLPFLDKDCSISPESTNLIIYGHNMLGGTMFQNLMKYEDEEYWREHPVIEVKTLYETRTYEIIGAFRDRVYYTYEDCFKFYQFIDPQTEEEFDEAISYFVENTPYDMGVEAECGDNLITLVTCAYHHQFGRYVVVAREITE